jgi:hypothetical protein
MSSVALYFSLSLVFLVTGYLSDVPVSYGFGIMFLGFGVASLVIALDARRRDAKAVLREERARQE